MTGKWDLFFRGQRMVVNLPAWAESHEIDDTGGILYHRDGQRTSWMHCSRRMTCPDWVRWNLIDWSKFHDAC